MRAFLDLFRNHAGPISFGFLLAFLSSFGQTFFIALSVPDIEASFALSHGEIGSVFSVATLASGLLMIWVGATIDVLDVRIFAAIALAGLGGAALTLSLAGHLAVLGIAIFALRLCGQGMLSHASVTSMARLPGGVRGRGIGMASLGFQAGAALFPILGVALISAIGWTAMWKLAAGALFAIAVLVLLRGLGVASPGALPASAKSLPRQSRLVLLRDPRFLLLVPSMLGPAAISTGYFFHQRFLAESKGWDLGLLGISVAFSALTSAVSAVWAGSLVDRLGAMKVSRLYLLPLALASVVLAVLPGPACALVFFGLLGLTNGASNVVVTAVLVEIFGSGRIGTVRALASSIMVIGSALTPGIFGLALDYGTGIAAIAFACTAYLVLASILNLLLRE